MKKSAFKCHVFTQAVSYYREKLEHTDQSVRIGACLAMGKLKVSINSSHCYNIASTYNDRLLKLCSH